MKRLLRHRTFRMMTGPVLNVELWPGDECWRASLHVNHWWFGRHYWHVFFLPEFFQ